MEKTRKIMFDEVFDQMSALVDAIATNETKSQKMIRKVWRLAVIAAAASLVAAATGVVALLCG